MLESAFINRPAAPADADVGEALGTVNAAWDEFLDDLAREKIADTRVFRLRLEAAGKAERWAEFDCGNVALVLPGAVAATDGVSRTKLALAVDDIGATHAWPTAQGANVLQPVRHYSVGRAFQMRDADGNTIHLHRRADDTCGQSPPSPATS